MKDDIDVRPDMEELTKQTREAEQRIIETLRQEYIRGELDRIVKEARAYCDDYRHNRWTLYLFMKIPSNETMGLDSGLKVSIGTRAWKYAKYICMTYEYPCIHCHNTDDNEYYMGVLIPNKYSCSKSMKCKYCKDGIQFVSADDLVNVY
jgi:hypothetical protein